MRRNRSKRRLVTRWLRAASLALLTGLVSACATAPATIPTSANGASSPVPFAERTNTSDGRLMRLWGSRSRDIADFPIGPGDVLQVSVPGVEELKDRTVRVSGDGDVSLPLIGTLHVAGLTESRTREELRKRLEKFMYHPQAQIFVKSFSSRQVAITGGVHSPGMYTLDSPSDTIRDIIERAGGMTDGAAQQIVLTPAPPGSQGALRSSRLDGSALPLRPAEGSSSAGEAAAAQRLPAGHFDAAAFSPSGTRVESVVINLAAGSGEQHYQDLPVRPGDTIYVPPAGSVTVIGWVYSPRTIPVAAGLTVLGAVSAAGGALFAADVTSVEVIRQGDGGKITVVTANLDEIKHLQQPDMLLRANDVVEVPYSAVRLPGYAIYYALQGIVSWTPAAAVASGLP
jgi:polysaccharide biosynthesis/export protein